MRREIKRGVCVVEIAFVGLIGPGENGRGFAVIFQDPHGSSYEGPTFADVMEESAPVSARHLNMLESNWEPIPKSRTAQEILADEGVREVIRQGEVTLVEVKLKGNETIH